MKKTLLLFLLFPLVLQSQDFQLKGTVRGLQAGKIGISGFYGTEQKAFDSIPVNDVGYFEYSFAPDVQTGMYRLRLNKNIFIDVIFNRENIVFTTDINHIIDSLVFLQSDENKLYYEYMNRRNITDYKTHLLSQFISDYPSDDPFYKIACQKYDTLRTEFIDFVNGLTEQNKTTFTAGYINMDFSPIPPSSIIGMQRIDYVRAHFFDRMDFSDTAMLYSDVISGKILQYLSLYQNNRLSKDMLQLEFIKAVKVIMEETKVNQEIYEFAMDFLINGFESYGFERVITYIADNIDLETTCENSERKATLEKKVESLKKFAVGKKAPDFTATDLDGNEVTLSEVPSEYMLLVFWATWCPHCTNIVPQLAGLYQSVNKDTLQVLAVSLDDSKEELEGFVKNNNLNWINVCDFKKWKGDVVEAYDVFATPTIFLLYKDRTILAKPATFNDIKNVLTERHILH